jgi:hypothetical protein
MEVGEGGVNISWEKLGRIEMRTTVPESFMGTRRGQDRGGEMGPWTGSYLKGTARPSKAT